MEELSITKYASTFEKYARSCTAEVLNSRDSQIQLNIDKHHVKIIEIFASLKGKIRLQIPNNFTSNFS